MSMRSHPLARKSIAELNTYCISVAQHKTLKDNNSMTKFTCRERNRHDEISQKILDTENTSPLLQGLGNENRKEIVTSFLGIERKFE